MRRLFVLSHKAVVKLYQLLAVVVLYGVLVCVVGYGFLMAFYAVNSTWVAPFIVTPTNDKILDLTSKLVASQQVLSTLIIDRDRLQTSLGEFRASKQELEVLDRQFRSAIVLQGRVNAVDQPELNDLSHRKQLDNEETTQVMQQIDEVEGQIDQDLSAGLITQGDAAIAKTQLRQSRNSATDNLIGEVLLRDTVRRKTPGHTETVDNLAKEAELRSNLVLLSIQIQSGEEQLTSDRAQIAELTKAIETARNSPYFLATKKDTKFAFVPYDNQRDVKAGVPIYDCYLNMIACRKVGSIKGVFKDEEHAVHPVFKNDIRGFLVELDLYIPEAAKDKVLFIGHKPLLI